MYLKFLPELTVSGTNQ